MSNETIDSGRQLAEAMGVSHTAVNKWLRDDRWPFGRGPWRRSLLPKIRKWQAANLSEDPANDADGPAVALAQLGPERKAKVAKTIVQTKAAQFDLEKKKGLYHLVEECTRHRLRQIHAVRQELTTVKDRLPPSTAQDVRDFIAAEMVRICMVFAGTNATPTEENAA